MDCRISVLASLGLALVSGCVTTQSTDLTKLPEGNVVVHKAPEGPKRPPLPGTVVALAVIKEREADKTKDPAQQMKYYDEARKYFQEALKIDDKYRDAVQGLARVYSHMDDYEHALPIYQKALDKNPKDHGLWFDLGLCYNRKKELAQAIPCLQKAMELDPENRQYMKTLGFTLARMGQTEQGMEYLTRALGSGPAHYNLARVLEHMGQQDKCRQHLQIALQINPNLDEAREMLEGLNNPGAARATE